MKYILFTLVVLCTLHSHSQPPKLSFNASGILSDNAKVAVPETFMVPNSTLTPDEIWDIKKALAGKVQNAINNMQDDSLHLKKLYKQLWGDAIVTEILTELRHLKTYLQGGNIPASAYKHVPNPADLRDHLFNAPVFSNGNAANGKEFASQRIIFTNPLKHYLLEYLHKTMHDDKIDIMDMDIAYKQGWRNLESAFKEGEQSLIFIQNLVAACGPTPEDSLTKYRNVTARLKNVLMPDANYIIQLLRNDFFKKWLWYTDGFLSINPINATTADRRYPASEVISLLDDTIRKKLYADTAQETNLQKFFATKKIKNERLIGINPKTDYLYYDAAASYKCLSETMLTKSRDNKKPLSILVYNVPLKDTLAISTTKSATTPDKSAAVQSIEAALDAGSPLKAILDRISGWNAGLNSISGSLNSTYPNLVLPELKYTIPNTPLTANPGKKIRVSRRTESLENSNSDKNLSVLWSMQKVLKNSDSLLENFSNLNGRFQNITRTTEEVEEETNDLIVTIGKRKITVSQVSDADKKMIINASFIGEDDDKCIDCKTVVEACVIDAFITQDNCYSLNYEPKAKQLQIGANLLLERFKCYVDIVKSKRKILADLYNEIAEIYLPQLKNYLLIKQRSLPPVLHRNDNKTDFVEAAIDETPEYRTVVFTPDLQAAPQKIVYEIYTSQKSQIINGIKQGDTNFVIKHSFKSASRHYVDFSVGLGYTLKDYQLKKEEGGLVKQSEADRFKPIAGMHIYPLGLLKVDDGIKPQLSRLSLFLGVSLKNALENLYTAISYDVVPGIRLMTGLHFYKDTRYTIINNTIADKASSFRRSGGFVSFNLEPATFGKLIGLLK